jgi:RimJ/RimL family protein N-acetyltransferase
MLTLAGIRVRLVEFTAAIHNNEKYFGWLRDMEIMRNVNRLEYLLPISRDVVDRYVSDVTTSDREAFFAIESAVDDVFIGTIRIAHIDWRMGQGDIGVMIGDRGYWGRGLATDAVSTLVGYGFEVLSLRKMISHPTATNVAMCKCFERVGFRREGRIRKSLLIGGKYQDAILYGIFRNEFEQRRRAQAEDGPATAKP